MVQEKFTLHELSESLGEDAKAPPVSCLLGIDWPSQASIDAAMGVLYMTLNGVQRLMHTLRRASQGLVPEEAVSRETGQLVEATEQVKAVLEKQQRAAEQLKTMVEVYERAVWEKTGELEQGRFLREQIEKKVFDSASELNSREELIQNLQQHILGLESKVFSHVNDEQARFRLYSETETQTDPIDDVPTEPRVVSDVSSAAPNLGRGRRKVNGKHPVLLGLRCTGCRSPMCPARWRALPSRVQGALAECQRRADAAAREEQAAVQELLSRSCTFCRDLTRADVAVRASAGDGALHRAAAGKDARQRSLLGLLLQNSGPAAATAPGAGGKSDPLSARGGPDSHRTTEGDSSPEDPYQTAPLSASTAARSQASRDSSDHSPSASVGPVIPSALSPADSSSATASSRLGSLSFFRQRKEKAAQDSAAARAKALEAAARLQEWKAHGFAFEVNVPKAAGQKLGLRLKDTSLEVLGIDTDSACSRHAARIPLGAFLVGIGPTPVSKMDPDLRALLHAAGSELALSFAPLNLNSPDAPNFSVPQSAPPPAPPAAPAAASRPVSMDKSAGEEAEESSSDEAAPHNDPLGVGNSSGHRSSGKLADTPPSLAESFGSSARFTRPPPLAATRPPPLAPSR
eukprot:Hpha_TRINITY_DN2830_c0_g1::TRINITY_DN2830_c0_g1_i1::g.171351::m.171351